MNIFCVYVSANKQESAIFMYVRAWKLDKFASLKILRLSLTKIDKDLVCGFFSSLTNEFGYVM